MGPPTKINATLQELERFQQSFDEVKENARALEEAVHVGKVSPSKARDDLAQLEAKLEKLQCTGVDSLEISDLSADKEVVKIKRKKLTEQSELLHETIDQLFETLKYVSTCRVQDLAPSLEPTTCEDSKICGRISTEAPTEAEYIRKQTDSPEERYGAGEAELSAPILSETSVEAPGPLEDGDSILELSADTRVVSACPYPSTVIDSHVDSLGCADSECSTETLAGTAASHSDEDESADHEESCAFGCEAAGSKANTPAEVFVCNEGMSLISESTSPDEAEVVAPSRSVEEWKASGNQACKTVTMRLLFVAIQRASRSMRTTQFFCRTVPFAFISSVVWKRRWKMPNVAQL